MRFHGSNGKELYFHLTLHGLRFHAGGSNISAVSFSLFGGGNGGFGTQDDDSARPTGVSAKVQILRHVIWN